MEAMQASSPAGDPALHRARRYLQDVGEAGLATPRSAALHIIALRASRDFMMPSPLAASWRCTSRSPRRARGDGGRS